MSSKVCIIGSGFVGQATGRGLAKHGNEVTFIDVSQEKVNELRDEGYKAFTPAEHTAVDHDVIMLCLPTPTVNNLIVLDYIKEGAVYVGKLIKDFIKQPTVVVRSTVLPGTTRNMVLPLLERHSGKKAGKDFHMAMQPEFLRQVTANQDFERPWYILIGEAEEGGGDTLEELYRPFNAPIERMSMEEAEMQKYVHNLYNAVKIAFFNEMRVIAKKEELDSEKIFEAVAQSCEGIWNPVYGLRDKGPFDGACLPKDTKAFRGWAQIKNHPVDVLKATIDQNVQYAKHHFRRIEESVLDTENDEVILSPRSKIAVFNAE